MKIRNLKIVVITLLLCLTVQSWAFDSGSTGVDGEFSPTADTSVAIPANGILNYTTFNVPSGVTVKFTTNAANTPVYILVEGDAVIDGTVDISGTDGTVFDTAPPGGFAGGLPELTTGGTGKGPGGGRGGQFNQGGNGGSYGSVGGNIVGSIAPIYGSSVLQPLLGGSGGGAVGFNATTEGARGGGGGGAMLLAVSGTLTFNGSILANGGNGSNAADDRTGSGGGSGGAVRLIASTLAGSGNVDISGGNPSQPISSSPRPGGAGGFGRARLEADAFSFTGTVTPNVAVVSAPLAIFPANLPNVRITSVAGVTVPANPTGDSDVVLPTSVSNPVTIGLAATDVPLSSTIDVTLTPSNGSASTVTSTALTGTVADSTATAEVSLPQGASTLVATVTFNVSGSTAALYKPYTNGELVAKVELRSTFGAGSEMLLTTENGNVYRVKS